MRNGVLISALAGAMFVGGCVTCGHKECPVCNPPKDDSGSRLAAPAEATSSTRSYQLPAADLVKHLEAALVAQGFTIASSQNGVIQTGWKEYPGEYHIARRWQEQSRFRVSVIPDVADPTTWSRYEVGEETQRRSNEKANWEPAGRRPERASQVYSAIAPASQSR